jgi:aryl-alcohol dehydrogenase-like predicted oxidoreductase
MTGCRRASTNAIPTPKDGGGSTFRRHERIELYQLHCIDPRTPLGESLGALKELQAQGKIRHIGLSEVTPQEIEQARKILISPH